MAKQTDTQTDRQTDTQTSGLVDLRYEVPSVKTNLVSVEKIELSFNVFKLTFMLSLETRDTHNKTFT